MTRGSGAQQHLDSLFVLAHHFEGAAFLQQGSLGAAPYNGGLVEESQGLGEAALSPAQRGFQVQQSPRIEHTGGIGARVPQTLGLFQGDLGQPQVAGDPQCVSCVGRRVAPDAIAPLFGTPDPLRDLSGEVSPRRSPLHIAGSLPLRSIADPFAQGPATAPFVHLDHRQTGLWGKTLQPPEQLDGSLTVFALWNGMGKAEYEHSPVGCIHFGSDSFRNSVQVGLRARAPPLARSAERVHKAQDLFRR